MHELNDGDDFVGMVLEKDLVETKTPLMLMM